MSTQPQTLQEAIVYFADRDNALNYVVKLRWPNGVTCPRCGSKDAARRNQAEQYDLLKRIEAWLIENGYDYGTSNGVRIPNELYMAVCNALGILPHWERESKTQT